MRMHMLLATTMFASAVMAAHSSQAQTTGGTKAQNTDNAVSEIIVTARLRAELETKTPAVVTAITPAQLERQSILTMEELSAAVPNVAIVPSFTSDVIFIRGIGNNGLQFAFEQQAGIFIDGVYYGNGHWVNGGMMDLSSLEILEGPQGAYFGKNTIAGAFNIHTANPSDHFETAEKIGYETEAAERYFNAMVSGPITDTFGARLAVYGTQMDGWAQTYTGVKEPGEKALVGRLTLEWKPTPDLDFNLKSQVQTYSNNGPRAYDVLINCGGPNNTPAPLARFGSPGSAPCQLNTTLPINQVTHLGDGYTNNPAYAYSLNVHWHQSFGDLTAITGVNRSQLSSQSQTSLGTTDLIDGIVKNHVSSLSQEVRYQTNLQWPVNFLVGVYAQSTKGQQEVLANVYPAAVQGGFVTYDRFFPQTGNTESAFGEAQWKINDKLELDLSDRYTAERKAGYYYQAYVINYAPARATYGQPNVPVHHAPLEFANNSPQAILTWKPTSDLMAYAAYKTGYLSGGFNSNVSVTPATNPASLTYGSEKVKGGEVGTKFYLADHRVQLNVVGYYYKYTGLQESVLDPNTLAYTVENAAGSLAEGAEVSGTAKLGNGFSVNGTLDYNHSYFTDYIGACLPGTTQGVAPCLKVPNTTQFAQDLTGRPTSFAPLWSGLIRLNYDKELSNGYRLHASVSEKYSGKYLVNDFLPQPAYWQPDANISIEKDNWTAAIIGRDLNNHLSCGYASAQVLTTVSKETSCQLVRPREIRFELGYKY